MSSVRASVPMATPTAYILDVHSSRPSISSLVKEKPLKVFVGLGRDKKVYYISRSLFAHYSKRMVTMGGISDFSITLKEAIFDDYVDWLYSAGQAFYDSNSTPLEERQLSELYVFGTIWSIPQLCYDSLKAWHKLRSEQRKCPTLEDIRTVNAVCLSTDPMMEFFADYYIYNSLQERGEDGTLRQFLLQEDMPKKFLAILIDSMVQRRLQILDALVRHGVTEDVAEFPRIQAYNRGDGKPEIKGKWKVKSHLSGFKIHPSTLPVAKLPEAEKGDQGKVQTGEGKEDKLAPKMKDVVPTNDKNGSWPGPSGGAAMYDHDQDDHELRSKSAHSRKSSVASNIRQGDWDDLPSEPADRLPEAIHGTEAIWSNIVTSWDGVDTEEAHVKREATGISTPTPSRSSDSVKSHVSESEYVWGGPVGDLDSGNCFDDSDNCSGEEDHCSGEEEDECSEESDHCSEDSDDCSDDSGDYEEIGSLKDELDIDGQPVEEDGDSWKYPTFVAEENDDSESDSTVNTNIIKTPDSTVDRKMVETTDNKNTKPSWLDEW